MRRIFRPRVVIYSVVLLLLSTSLLGSLLFLRSPVKLDVVRDRGVLSRLVEDGFIENLYRLQIMNATETAQHYTLAVSGLTGIALVKPVDVIITPAEARWVAVAVRIPPQTAAQAGSGAHAIELELLGEACTAARASLKEKSTFVVPR